MTATTPQAPSPAGPTQPRKRVRQAAEDLAAALGLGDEVLWVSACEARPDLDLSKAPGSLPGLLNAQCVTIPAGPLLLSYWRGQRFFEVAADRWTRFTERPVIWEGPIGQAYLREQSFFTPKSAGDLALKLSALIGAVSVILGAWDRLVAPVEVRLDPPHEIRATAGAPFEADISVTNWSRVDVDLSLDTTLPPGVGVVRAPRRIRAGATGEVIRIAGIVPMARTQPHTLRVGGKAEASGFNPRGSALETVEVPLRVYPSTFARRELQVVSMQGPICSVRATLDLGREYPKGLRCIAELTGASVLRAVAAGAVATELGVNHQVPGNEISSLRWTTPPLQARYTHESTIVLKVAGEAPQACQALVSSRRLTWECV